MHISASPERVHCDMRYVQRAIRLHATAHASWQHAHARARINSRGDVANTCGVGHACAPSTHMPAHRRDRLQSLVAVRRRCDPSDFKWTRPLAVRPSVEVGRSIGGAWGVQVVRRSDWRESWLDEDGSLTISGEHTFAGADRAPGGMLPPAI